MCLTRDRGQRVRASPAAFSKNINPSFVLVQTRKTCLFMNERLLMGRKESNQTNKTIRVSHSFDPDRVIWVQTACKGYRQKTLAGKIIFQKILLGIHVSLEYQTVCIKHRPNVCQASSGSKLFKSHQTTIVVMSRQ